MSVSHNTYLGPYFRCRTRTETVTVEVVACPNPACIRHGKSLFLESAARRYCPHCGTQIDRAFPVEEVDVLPDRWDVSEAVDEALTEVTGDDADFPEDFEYHLWVPNAARFGGPKRAKADSSCGVEIVLDGVDIEAEKAWLDGAYPERETLVELYGMGRVETRWGLIRWCSRASRRHPAMSKPPREEIGSFLVDSGCVLVGEPCHLVPGEGEAPLVTYDRLMEMFHEQGRAWTEPAIAAGGVEVVPAAERRERAAVAAIPAPGGGTAGLAISVGCDGRCRVYLGRDEYGNPERIVIEIGHVEL